MMILMFMLLAVAIGEISGIETFVMAILGAAGTFIIQGIKRFTGTTTIRDTKALNLTVVVSAVLALIGAFATDAFITEDGGVTVQSIINGGFVVFGVATLVYKYLLANDTAVVDTPETPLT